jgi:hypothetical protein
LRENWRGVQQRRQQDDSAWSEDAAKSVHSARTSLNYAAVVPADRVQQFCAGSVQRNPFAVAFEADGSAENQRGGSVVLLAGVATGDDSVRFGIEADHAMQQNTVRAKRERNVSATQFAGGYLLGDNRIAIQDVRLHALPVREETHLQAALQHGFAQHRELRRITPQ